ncbi:MAG: response regulator [Sulfurospirillum sp.]|jgi:putative two-component system response regulator|uniref:HD-GYP domain-containing protein n=1 Tax=Sulfurospirillum sp. UCH001 TaxID=1581011 RepID=UPI0008316FB0|nr:HD domain-containing phosphohydrolase [Sulfurospirillum sp. UCH001]
MAKILVIDDTPEYIEMLSSILSEYEVYAAKEGKKGILLAETVQPDLILLDINMPLMTGYEVCRRLKQIEKVRHIPVIFLTANDGSDYEEIGFNLGAVDFISKPFHAALLKARVRTHVSLFQLQSNLQAQVDSQTEEIRKLNHEMTYLSASIAELKSKETGQHLRRVAEFCYLFCKFLGKDEAECEKIKMASVLHDIGKVGISDDILNKPAKLNDEEWKVMKQHSLMGYEMLIDSEFELMRLAAMIALEHHERWDGEGYPYGKKGDEISLVGRICAVSDVFDSLLDKRVYKEPWEEKVVRDYFVMMKGSQFDPVITDILLENFDMFIYTWKSLQRSRNSQ